MISIKHLQAALLFVAALLPGVACEGGAGLDKTAGVTPAMLKRATQFRTVIQSGGRFRSGVYVYESRTVKDYAAEPEKLAARLALLGFTDVYLTCGSGAKSAAGLALAWRRTFIRVAHGHGMRVHAQTLERGRLFVDDQAVIEDCAAVLDYNKSVVPGERFAGVSADLEPHIMKHGAAERPKELALVWDSEKNAGIGRDNDLLLKRTTEVLALARKTIGPLPLRQAVGFFFQNRYDAGEVANGGARQFLQSCDALIVMAYNNRKERIWSMAEPTIKAAGSRPACVSVCIKTSHGIQNGKADPTSLQPLGWDNMSDAVKYIISKGETTRAFLGVDIYEYQGFEMMWADAVVNQPR
ncbi:hypothetical protein OH491_20765 [Termitidicoccus mucosus]|uniref:hypothetical protein n=1 Tax=Termitidicoccus mucosus TaxID=1184151 RepID=UPI0011AB643D